MKQSYENLGDFIYRARTLGKSTADIRNLLANAGWKVDQIDPYLSDETLIPPPPPTIRTSGRDVFFYLLSFFTLAISATSLGGIAFGIINRYFSDEVLAQSFTAEQLQWSLAWFIVTAPVFFFVSRRLVRDVPTSGVQVPSIRRVLTYLALFLASAVVIGDIASLVYRFVSGTVTSRFSLKVFVILVIGGWILWYYWVNVRTGERGVDLPKWWHRTHAYTLAAVAAIAVIFGFILSGTPAEQRSNVRDEQRVGQLQAMYQDVQRYYEFEKKLPSTAEIVTLYEKGLPQDPASGVPYEYIAGDGLAFNLCATFEGPSPDIVDPRSPKPLWDPYSGNWSHPAGRHCFDLQVRPIIK